MNSFTITSLTSELLAAVTAAGGELDVETALSVLRAREPRVTPDVLKVLVLGRADSPLAFTATETAIVLTGRQP
ncbi:MAG TPA: hypothetical protein PLW14_11230 [Chlorobiota bacterium]|nr:hypothetical protein [Chlorobiota bacterium]